MLNSLKTTFQEVTKEVFKEAGKKIRREVDNWTTFRPAMSEDVSDCLEDHRGQPMKKLAELRVVVRQCNGLSTSSSDEYGNAIDSYVVVQVEGATRSTSVMYREADPVFNAAMNFTVRNLTGDVIIQVYNNSETPAFGNKFIGQALVPIASLLPRLEPAVVEPVRYGAVAVGAKAAPVPLSMRTTLELELYPLPKDATKFQQAPLEMRGDVRGLARPAASLGRVQVEATLTLEQPLLRTYLAASMPGPLSKRAALRISSGKDADEEDLDFNVIRWNALRIRDALCTAPSWWALVKHLRSWRQPWLSVAAILLFSSIALRAQLWQVPMLLSGTVLVLGKYSAAARRARRAETVSPWHQELQSKRDKTLVAKALKGKALILRVQKETGRVASLLERLRNALNWSDPNVSMVVAAAITAGGGLLSVMFLLVELLWPILPVRFLLTAAVVAVLLPPPVRDTLEEYKLKVFGALIKDVWLGVGLSTSLSTEAGGGGEEDVEYVTIGAGEAPASEQNEGDLGAAGHCILAMSKLCASVPDELEMTHRVIARQQVKGLASEIVEVQQRAAEQEQGDRAPGSQAAEREGGRAAGGQGREEEEEREAPEASAEEPGAEGGQGAGAVSGSRPMVLRREEGAAAARREAEGDRLVQEVMEELGGGEGGAVEVGWSAGAEAEMEEEAVQAAMKMSVAEIRTALRQAGGDASGLIEKAEMARELARCRVRGMSPSAANAAPKPSTPKEAGSAKLEGSAGAEGLEAAEAEAARRSQLALLAEMGFSDEEENRRLLQRFNGDVDQAIKHVLKK